MDPPSPSPVSRRCHQKRHWRGLPPPSLWTREFSLSDRSPTPKPCHLLPHLWQQQQQQIWSTFAAAAPQRRLPPVIAATTKSSRGQPSPSPWKWAAAWRWSLFTASNRTLVPLQPHQRILHAVFGHCRRHLQRVFLLGGG